MVPKTARPWSHAAQANLRLWSRLFAITSATASAGTGMLLLAKLGMVHEEHRAMSMRWWGRLLLSTLRVDTRLDSELPGELTTGASLVVANHRSIVDIPVLLSLTGAYVLSRGDIAQWPVFGRVAELAGTIYVDRLDAHSGAGAIQRMGAVLRGGHSLCVFPEGTTFPGDEVRPFRPGAFVAVARERGTVVPVGIAYEDEASIYGDEPLWDHLRRLAIAPRTKVAVSVGPPIAARGLGLRELTHRAQQQVQALVHRARRLL